MSVEELRALLERVLAHDPAAEDQFYEHIRPILRPMIARLLRHSAARAKLDPTEVIHSALGQLLAKAAVPLPDDPRAWLAQVCRNRVLREMRAHGTARTRSFAEGEDAACAGEGPVEELVNREELERLRRHLSPGAYASLVLVKVEGGSWAEAHRLYAPASCPSSEAWRKACEREMERYTQEGR